VRYGNKGIAFQISALGALELKLDPRLFRELEIFTERGKANGRVQDNAGVVRDAWERKKGNRGNEGGDIARSRVGVRAKSSVSPSSPCRRASIAVRNVSLARRNSTRAESTY